jgi:hypothetical protein
VDLELSCQVVDRHPRLVGRDQLGHPSRRQPAESPPRRVLRRPCLSNPLSALFLHNGMTLTNLRRDFMV